jgi:hypothetical protein
LNRCCAGTACHRRSTRSSRQSSPAKAAGSVGKPRAIPPIDPRLGAERRWRAGQGTQAASKRRGSGTAPSLTLLEFARQVPEPKMGALNFALFPFQPEMYEVLGSRVRDVVVRKCTQVGISALLVRWALSEADLYSHTVLYVMPTLGDVFDFADGRVTPLFERSEYLWERKGDPFNKGLRRVGNGIVYFRGSENKRGLDSVDADALALDEYDTLNQANVPDAERRLSAVTSAGLIRRVGVPSLPEFGIAEKYDESDRRLWLVRCSCRYVGWTGSGPISRSGRRTGGRAGSLSIFGGTWWSRRRRRGRG